MVTNIVFDLGDVLISGDFTKSLTEDTRIPNEYIEDLEKCWILDHTSFTETCTRAEYLKKVNEITPMYLRKYIPIVCEISVSYLEVMNHTLALINSLRERGYNIYYLSNWSKWHVQELKRANKFEFLKLMDGGIFSYETGYMKPDRRIYKYFLYKYNLDPSTCIFFDDKEENVKAAKNVGMKAEVFNKDKGDELLAKFILNESTFKRSELPADVFGIPQERKYPMPDEKHTRSAIKLFNHVEPKYEKQLAKKVISNMKKYNIPYSIVGDKNRLKKYLPKSVNESSNIQKFDSPEQLQQWMKQNISYKNYTKLMPPEEVYNSKKGSCHDQVMFELYCLRQMKKNPKALFIIEYIKMEMEEIM